MRCLQEVSTGHSLLARPLLGYLPAIGVTRFLPVIVVVVVVMVARAMIITTFHVILLFIFLITAIGRKARGFSPGMDRPPPAGRY